MRRVHLAFIIAVSVLIAGCGNEADPIAQLRAQVRDNPESADLRVQLGDAYMEADSYHDAYVQYSTAQDLAPSSFEATLGLARAHEQLNDVDAASMWVDNALEIDPGAPEALALRGKLLLRADKPDEAAAALAGAIEADPDNETGHRLLPLAYARTNEFGSAEAAAREALEVLPESVEAQMNLATVLLAREKTDEAETVLRKAMELDPADPVPPLRLAELLVREGEQLEEAIDLADRSTELDAGEGAADAVAALALRKQGQAEMAIRRLHTAAMAHPRNVRLWLMLASLYREIGEEEAAARAAGMAFRFAPRRRLRTDPVPEGEAPATADQAVESVDPTEAIPDDPADASAELLPGGQDAGDDG